MEEKAGKKLMAEDKLIEIASSIHEFQAGDKALLGLDLCTVVNTKPGKLIPWFDWEELPTQTHQILWDDADKYIYPAPFHWSANQRYHFEQAVAKQIGSIWGLEGIQNGFTIEGDVYLGQGIDAGYKAYAHPPDEQGRIFVEADFGWGKGPRLIQLEKCGFPSDRSLWTAKQREWFDKQIEEFVN